MNYYKRHKIIETNRMPKLFLEDTKIIEKKNNISELI